MLPHNPKNRRAQILFSLSICLSVARYLVNWKLDSIKKRKNRPHQKLLTLEWFTDLLSQPIIAILKSYYNILIAQNVFEDKKKRRFLVYTQ